MILGINSFNIILSNTAPIINLSNTNSLDLILKVIPCDAKLVIPQEVINEITQEPAKSRVHNFIENNSNKVLILPGGLSTCIDKVQAIANHMVYEFFTPYSSRKSEDHITECYIIYLAREHGAFTIILDETAAKQEAKYNRVPSVSHADIIRFAYDKKAITKEEAKKLFEKNKQEFGHIYKNIEWIYTD